MELFVPAPNVIFKLELQGIVTRSCEKQSRVIKSIIINKQNFIMAIFNQAQLLTGERVQKKDAAPKLSKHQQCLLFNPSYLRQFSH